MGLFDSIKRNLNVGGPGFTLLDTPSQVQLKAGTAQVKLNLRGGANAKAHVNTITIFFERTPKQKNPNQANMFFAVSTLVLDNDGAGWNLAEGEDLPFELAIPLASEGKEKPTGLLGQLGQFASTLDTPVDRFDWRFRVVADVERTVFDPTMQNDVDVLPDSGVFGPLSGRTVDRRLDH